MSAGVPDVRYLTWLYNQVSDVGTRKGPDTFWKLIEQLSAIEFAWFVPNDDNRATDGRELRREWAVEEGADVDSDWLEVGCSFLEMLIGLTRHLEFTGGFDAEWWFWKLMNNLDLTGFTDESNFDPQEVEDITSRVIWRTYNRRGVGGLFPLERSRKDQRKVEIWYQLCEYLLQYL